ncbi:RNA polymerase sigma factor [Steroidobacter flavus]|uniref:RNA polymerase sigma factor n=1 Tax=Steroidobacter flavus TaxID=1842136 RepID=A0ABV8T247_9GAMM
MRATGLVATFEQYYDELLGFVRTRIGCAATAADIMQDTYLRVCASESEHAIANPKAFVYRIASNLTIDHLRRNKSRGKVIVADEVPEDEHPQAPSPEREWVGQERLHLLMQAIGDLPPRCREVFVLRQFENLHQAEIAERLGISRNMVEKHLRVALLHCMQRVGDEE